MKMSVAGSHLCPLSANPSQTATVTEHTPAARTMPGLLYVLSHLFQIIFIFLLLRLLVVPYRQTVQNKKSTCRDKTRLN